jgi:hypothetical protein
MTTIQDQAKLSSTIPRHRIAIWPTIVATATFSAIIAADINLIGGSARTFHSSIGTAIFLQLAGWIC